ncbi:hypothetical protein [Rufibacter aurantiacus]|uniref:hypothetical protein n=1 Tax=Rufibacter aurantiacus TaxID=2817374 RepID=UPI001B3093FB|nr:hypothetical protein [Rufibacter aurantiacus]
MHLQPDSSVIRYRNGVKATGSFSVKTNHTATQWYVAVKFDDPSVAFHTFGNRNQGFGQEMWLGNGEAEYLLLDYSPADGPTAYYQKVTETK